jgi:hypothetical protein
LENRKLGQEIEYLEVKFALGSITLIVGFIGASIALFQWIERTGAQHLFGDYSRYVLGFGGFAAMIFGAMLINDVLVLSNIMKGKYGLLPNYKTIKPIGIHKEVKTSSEVYDEFQIPSSLPEYKKRIIRNILKVSGLRGKSKSKPTRRKA